MLTCEAALHYDAFICYSLPVYSGTLSPAMLSILLSLLISSAVFSHMSRVGQNCVCLLCIPVDDAQIPANNTARKPHVCGSGPLDL
jgi:hypothetical protein